MNTSSFSFLPTRTSTNRLVTERHTPLIRTSRRRRSLREEEVVVEEEEEEEPRKRRRSRYLAVFVVRRGTRMSSSVTRATLSST